MKVLVSNDMIQLLPAPEADAERLASLFEAIAPVSVKSDTGLAAMVTCGAYKVEQVQFNGSPAYLLWHSKTDDNGLWVHACQAYTSDMNVSIAFLAAKAIADRDGCGYIRFMTKRAGLVRAAVRHGFNVEGIILHK